MIPSEETISLDDTERKIAALADSAHTLLDAVQTDVNGRATPGTDRKSERHHGQAESAAGGEDSGERGYDGGAHVAENRPDQRPSS